MAAALEKAHDAFEAGAWGEAVAGFSELESDSLEAADAERLAIAAYLVGSDEQSAAAWEIAHRAALRDGDPASAATHAFWLALSLMLRGQMAQAAGWLERAAKLLDEVGTPCAASGYVLIPALLSALDGGDHETARALALQAKELGDLCDDADLSALGSLALGQALLASGDTSSGLAELDGVMIGVIAGEVGPISTGLIYCAAVLECMQILDLPRAAEWTTALSGWCDEQPDLVPYRGQCLVHRSQVQQATGDWSRAVEFAEDACARLTDPPHPALGLAHYQRAELKRLSGLFEEARDGYREASRHGYHPVPGLALLDLARGDVKTARASIETEMSDVAFANSRAALVAAAVQIRRADGDLPAARTGASELGELAGAGASQVVVAMAAEAEGSVGLGEGDPAGALVDLREAERLWRLLDMPYDGARTSVLVGLAYAALGDESSSKLEFENAADAFLEVGARPDFDQVVLLMGGFAAAERADAPEADSPLTAREQTVLRHVASGLTNKQVASELNISEHTVGRHLENIYVKLGVSNRAAATAYALRRGLL